jgi:gamma-glutamylcyclotransferase (GGCT)/AIG2-like uncharacterized protein YtfP
MSEEIDLTDAAIARGTLDTVFCYGTLLPGESRWRYLEPFVVSHDDDRVSGRLFDTGFGYPAARFDHVGVITGRVFRLDSHRLVEAFELLDEIEGAVDGLYHRVSLVTSLGVAAYGYQHGGALEGLVPISGGDWLAWRRGGRG